MFRVSGYEHEKVREIADEVSNIMVTNDKVKEVKFNWKEKSKVMHLDLDQDKLRNLGIDAKTFSLSLQTQLSGAAIAEYYEGDKTVDIVFRMSSDAREDLSLIHI